MVSAKTVQARPVRAQGVGMVPGVLGVMLAAAYLLAGIGVAVGFLARGIARMDPAAAGANGFRVVIFPGLVLLWPLVAWRWWRLARRAV